MTERDIMKKLGDFMLPALAKKGLKKESEGALVCFHAEEWGKPLVKPISFATGILKVSVPSSSAAQELSMREEDLIKYINDKMGKKLVRTIRIVKSS